MIHLEESQKKIIRTIKGHHPEYFKDVPEDANWKLSLQPLFSEIYGYDFRDYHESTYVMFHSLLEIWQLIKENNVTNQLEKMFEVSFHKTISRNEDAPVDRVISELCGLIQCNSTTKRYDCGIYHYETLHVVMRTKPFSFWSTNDKNAITKFEDFVNQNETDSEIEYELLKTLPDGTTEVVSKFMSSHLL